MDTIVQIILGVVLIVIGIVNFKGNVSILHSYHTKRVKEEDKIPFGRKIGVGTIIIGVTIIVSGILTYLSKTTLNTLYLTISNIVMGVGLAVGFIFIFYAMIKYNKGVF